MPADQANHDGLIEVDCRRAVVDLREALGRLYAAVGADPLVPQEVSRRFGLNKNLTWKISRITSASDPLTAIRHVPGSAGLTILIDAFRKAGSAASLIEGVQAAARSFDKVVQAHAGDRAGLELMLDSMGIGYDHNALERSRELAYLGNSGVWGVAARVKIVLAIFCPGVRRPGTVDVMHVTGYFGFRRLRAVPEWEVARFDHFTDAEDRSQTPAREGGVESTGGGLGQPTSWPDIESITPATEGKSPTFSRVYSDYCSPMDLPIHVKVGPSGQLYMLGPADAGHRHAVDVFFGQIVRGNTATRTASEHQVHLSTATTTPSELQVFDAIVHKDVLPNQHPTLSIFGRLDMGRARVDELERAGCTIPFSEQVLEVSPAPEALQLGEAPRYVNMVRDAYARMNASPNDFRAYRVAHKHPVTPSTTVLSWQLPSA
jgi:hypothetical protein